MPHHTHGVSQVSKPFFGTLHRWIYSGDLHDPFLEFFVGIDPAFEDQQYAAVVNSFDDEGKAREGGLSLWQSKYAFRKEMLPRFVGEDFGRKVNNRKPGPFHSHTDIGHVDLLNWQKFELHQVQLSRQRLDIITEQT